MTQITINPEILGIGTQEIINNLINGVDMAIAVSVGINAQLLNVVEPPSEILLGEELVVNGTFDTDTTGWGITNVGAISSVSGKLSINNIAFVQVTQLVTVEVGKTYQYSADFEFIDTACIYSHNKNSSGSSSYAGAGGNLTETSTSSGTLVATQTELYIILFIPSTTASTANFDNISIREIIS